MKKKKDKIDISYEAHSVNVCLKKFARTFFWFPYFYASFEGF